MKTLYLDHAATTPVRDEVVEAMSPFLGDRFANASSLHGPGQSARAALERARSEVAAAIGARPAEIRFVRGGTESDNLAVIGGYRAMQRAGGGRRVAITAVEHSAVLESATYLADREEAELYVAPVSADGSVDFAAIEDHVSVGGLVSMMWVNNETGMTLPVADAASRLAGKNATLHTDASQAIGKVPVDVRDVSVDLLTGTAHKLEGPKGVGFLFVREGVTVEPLIHGGTQERSLRPGTEDVAGAVGLATAVRLAVEELDANVGHFSALRDDVEARLAATVPGLRINAGDSVRAPHISSLGVPGIEDGAALLMALDLDGAAVSGGSACHSGSQGGSHVMKALYGAEDTYAPLRVSFGRTTTADDVREASAIIERVVRRLRGAALEHAG